MAVQAQSRSSALALDYRGRDRESLLIVTLSNTLIEAHVHLGEQQKILINGAGISNPESELTCNAYGSRKRSRDDGEVTVFPQDGCCNNHQLQQQMRFASAINPNYAGLQLSYELHRHIHQRSAAGHSPLVQDLVSLFYHQSLDIDALIRF